MSQQPEFHQIKPVTIGGQLSLLMLIERMELAGIRVISANTDGVELSIPFGREWMADLVIRIMDYAGAMQFDLAGTIAEKLAYNTQRHDHTAEVRAAEGGKKL